MKRAKTMLGTLAFLGLGFLFAVPANAADYSGNCAGVTAFNGTGNVNITDTACTLPQSITATGTISISATSISGSGKNLTSGSTVNITASGGNIELMNVTSSGDSITIDANSAGTVTVGTLNSQSNTILRGTSVTANNITSNWGVKATATDGTLDLQSITSNANNSGFGGNVLLTATGNIKTQNITNGGSTTTGGIEINANTSGTSTVFNIGGGGSNGTGVLKVSNTTGGGSDQYYMPAGIYVSNGDSSSTGGITVNSMSDLLLTSSGGRAGILILDAKAGTLTLPAGTLNAGVSSSVGAGSIYLLGDTISTASGTVISASHNSTAAGNYHVVALSADDLNVTGSGLEIHADGKGVSGYPGSATAHLMPSGGITVTSNSDLNSLYWTITWVNYMNHSSDLTVSGSAPITVTASGDNSQVTVTGNSITFANSDVTLEAKGGQNHEIWLANFAMVFPDINFNNTGNVSINASNDDGDGGKIYLYGHTVNVEKNIDFNADAGTDGTGGQISVSTSWDSGSGFQLNPYKKATFSANGAGSGSAVYSASDTYDPKAIQFYPGNNPIYLGTGNGQMTFSATGGDSGGNGGAVVTSALNIELKTVDAVDVSASGGNGNGGGFFSFSYMTGIEPGVNATVINASGHGNGIGGSVQTYYSISDWDFLTYIKVDAGSSLQTTEADYGRLTLNGVTCQQRYVGTSWPKTYWNCRTTGTSSSLDQTPRDTALGTQFNNLRALLGTTNKTEIFVFEEGPDYVGFYNDYQPATAGGLTFKLGQHIYVNPWQSGSIGDAATVVSYSAVQLKEVTAHELGHAVDVAFANGGTLPSEGSDWTSNNNRDTTFDLDQVFDPTISQMVHRYPCKPTPFSGGGQSTNIPFAGVTHLPTGLSVCLGNGDVNNAILSGGNSWNQATVKGTEVLSHIENIVATSKKEVHAQIFAYKAVGNLGARPMIDKVFDNNFFPCLKAWADTELTGSLPSNGSCGASLTP